MRVKLSELLASCKTEPTGQLTYSGTADQNSPQTVFSRIVTSHQPHRGSTSGQTRERERERERENTNTNTNVLFSRPEPLLKGCEHITITYHVMTLNNAAVHMHTVLI